MVVMLATRIKRGLTCGTDRAALEVLSNRQLFAAGSTQQRLGIKLTARPHLNRMVRFRLMAGITCIVGLAASHLDGHDIKLAVPMRTTRVPVKRHPIHLNAMNIPLHQSFRHAAKAMTGTVLARWLPCLQRAMGHIHPIEYLRNPRCRSYHMFDVGINAYNL